MNVLDSAGSTPLMISVSRGYRAMTELLLAHGADPNKAPVVSESSTGPFYNRTALSIAVTAENLPLASLLISNKANVDARVYWRASPEAGEETPLMPLIGLAVRQGSIELMKLLLDSGANPAQPDQNGSTPLMLAAANGVTPATKLLLDRGVNPNQATENSGWTALHAAANSAPVELIRLLVARGADLNARTKEGATPLFQAVSGNRSAAVKALLELGADPNIATTHGLTALSVAQNRLSGPQSRESVEAAPQIVDLLLAHGANPFAQRLLSIAMGDSTNSLGVLCTRGTNDWNRYTLFESLAGHIGAYPWADWTNASIERVAGRGLTNLPVNLGVLFASGNCSNDLWLEWGDQLLLPELDHPLNAPAPVIPTNAQAVFDKCLPRTVHIVVKGETNDIRLLSDSGTFQPFARPPMPAFTGGVPTGQLQTERVKTVELRSFRLKEVVLGSGLLRASSDMTRVHIRRGEREWLVNLNEQAFRSGPIAYTGNSGVATPSPGHDLWLRDGDVIEIPEKQ
jgi:ankyrin repeat protein